MRGQQVTRRKGMWSSESVAPTASMLSNLVGLPCLETRKKNSWFLMLNYFFDIQRCCRAVDATTLRRIRFRDRSPQARQSTTTTTSSPIASYGRRQYTNYNSIPVRELATISTLRAPNGWGAAGGGGALPQSRVHLYALFRLDRSGSTDS